MSPSDTTLRTADAATTPTGATLAPERRRAPAPSPPTPERRPPIRWREIFSGLQWQHGAAIVLALAVCVPLVVLFARMAGIDWLPTGDRALMELRVRDVGSDNPLLGPYSRYGWSHPGPMIYWLLAVPYRLLGSTSDALLLGTVLLNGAMVTGTLALAWRRGRLPLLAITATAIGLFLRAMLPMKLVDSWNPFVTVLPLLLFCFLAWSVRERERWAPPLLLLLGSFLVGSHVGYLPVAVAVACAWAFWGVARGRWADACATEAGASRGQLLRATVRPGPAAACCALVVLLCWAPVVIDQVAGTHNLTRVTDYFTSPQERTVGNEYALGVSARELLGEPNRELGQGDQRRLPPWMGGPEPVSVIGGQVEPAPERWLALPLGLALVAFAAAGFAARRADRAQLRRRARAAQHLQVLAVLSVTVGWLSVSRISDWAFDYLIRWWWILSMVFWISVAWALWCSLAAVPVRWRRGWAFRGVRIAGGLLAVAMIVNTAVLTAHEFADAVPPEPEFQAATRALAGPTIDATAVGGPVHVRTEGAGAGSVADGIRLQLERADRRVVVNSDMAYKFGSHRDVAAVKPVTTVYVVQGTTIVDFARRRDLHQVAMWDPLEAHERALYFEDVEVLRNQFLAAHDRDLFDALYSDGSLFRAHGLKGVDEQVLERVEKRRAAGWPIAVFVGNG